jgi:hypothetical protein
MPGCLPQRRFATEDKEWVEEAAGDFARCGHGEGGYLIELGNIISNFLRLIIYFPIQTTNRILAGFRKVKEQSDILILNSKSS